MPLIWSFVWKKNFLDRSKNVGVTEFFAKKVRKVKKIKILSKKNKFWKKSPKSKNQKHAFLHISNTQLCMFLFFGFSPYFLKSFFDKLRTYRFWSKMAIFNVPNASDWPKYYFFILTKCQRWFLIRKYIAIFQNLD